MISILGHQLDPKPEGVSLRPERWIHHTGRCCCQYNCRGRYHQTSGRFVRNKEVPPTSQSHLGSNSPFFKNKRTLDRRVALRRKGDPDLVTPVQGSSDPVKIALKTSSTSRLRYEAWSPRFYAGVESAKLTPRCYPWFESAKLTRNK